MNNTTKEVIATSAGLLSIVGLAALNIPIAITAIAGLGIYTATKLLIPNSFIIDLNKYNYLPPDIKSLASDCLNLIGSIQIRLTLESFKENLDDLKNIIEISKKIVQLVLNNQSNDTASNSDQLRSLKRILSFLDSILGKYNDIFIHTQNLDFKKFEASKAQLKKVLNNTLSTLIQYYKNGLKGDLLDLDVDMKVLSSLLDKKDDETT